MKGAEAFTPVDSLLSSFISILWDAVDRLTKATMPGGSSASYKYDHDNRRIQQVAATTTNYLWDEQSAYGDVVVEADGTWGNPTSYVLGGGELLSQSKGSSTSYFLKDGQGSTRAFTNSTGGITQSFVYEAFGKLQSPTTTLGTNYLYRSAI